MNFDHKDSVLVHEALVERDAVLDQLKFNLQKAQQYMKTQVDKRRLEIEFVVHGIS